MWLSFVLNPNGTRPYRLFIHLFYFLSCWFHLSILFSSFNDCEFCISVQILTVQKSFSTNIRLFWPIYLFLWLSLFNLKYKSFWLFHILFSSVFWEIDYVSASANWFMVNFEYLLDCETSEWVVWFDLFAAEVVFDIAWLAKCFGFYCGVSMDYFIV